MYESQLPVFISSFDSCIFKFVYRQILLFNFDLRHHCNSSVQYSAIFLEPSQRYNVGLVR